MCSSLKRVGLSLTPFRTVMMPWYSSSLSLFEACDRDLTQARMGHPGHGVPQKRQEHAWTLETERKGQHSSSVCNLSDVCDEDTRGKAKLCGGHSMDQ